MDISTIIPTLNEGSVLPSCLETLMPQLSPNDEVIVVDAASTDRSVEIAHAYGCRTLLYQGSTRGQARDFGVSCSKNEIILQTDADVIFPEGFITKLRGHYESQPVIGVSGGWRDAKGRILGQLTSAVLEKVFQYADAIQSYRRDIYPLTHGHPNTNFGEQVALWLEIRKLGPTIYDSCYDKETRVLTRDGFKYFKDLTYNDGIATLNRETEQLEYQKPIAILKYDWNGEMIHFKGRRYDLLVTPSHNMLVRFRSRKNPKWELIKACEITGHHHQTMHFKRDAKWKGIERKEFVLPDVKRVSEYPTRNLPDNTNNVKAIHMDDWLTFLGWYLSEGSIYKPSSGNYRVTISNNNLKNRETIANLLKRMGVNPHIAKKAVILHSKQLYSYLKQFGKARDKFIPKEVKGLPPHQLKILLNSLFQGDGTFERGEMRKYTTVSKRLAEDVAETLIKAGYGASITTIARQRFGPLYRVSVSHKFKNLMFSKNYKIVKYKGPVYDVTVPNHTLLVERNGKIIWSGNSMFVYHLSDNQVRIPSYMIGAGLFGVGAVQEATVGGETGYALIGAGAGFALGQVGSDLIKNENPNHFHHFHLGLLVGALGATLYAMDYHKELASGLVGLGAGLFTHDILTESLL